MNLSLTCFTFVSPPSSFHQSSFVPVSPTFSLWTKQGIILKPKLFNGFSIPTPYPFGKRSLIVRVSGGIDGKDGNGPDTMLPKGSEEAISIENLPLESKERLKLEQKLRMKLAKKIRLRRKRLVRKRRMRKKGRWPPSKMKKNKNV